MKITFNYYLYWICCQKKLYDLLPYLSVPYVTGEYCFPIPLFSFKLVLRHWEFVDVTWPTWFRNDLQTCDRNYFQVMQILISAKKPCQNPLLDAFSHFTLILNCIFKPVVVMSRCCNVGKPTASYANFRKFEVKTTFQLNLLVSTVVQTRQYHKRRSEKIRKMHIELFDQT